MVPERFIRSLKNLSNTNRSTDESVDECRLSDDALGGLSLLGRAHQENWQTSSRFEQIFERLFLTLTR